MQSASEDPAIILGMTLPDSARWSERVVVALGQNPSAFTGPGTNTYLVGTGEERILIDSGDGRSGYPPVLARAMHDTGCRRIREIVLTHGHPDHIGGSADLVERFGPMPVRKMPWPEMDARQRVALSPLRDGDAIEVEGAHLRALHTPGHAPDHLCFLLKEEHALFSGDNVLGVGTTVIPAESGDLGDYMRSLARMLESGPERIYPAHGPLIEDGRARLREYIAHREQREEQILAAIEGGARVIPEMVRIIYAAYPVALHAAAGESVAAHLRKLEAEGRVAREAAPHAGVRAARWRRG